MRRRVSTRRCVRPSVRITISQTCVKGILCLMSGLVFMNLNKIVLSSSQLRSGRQKLARFNKREFSTLILDILTDAKRRQLGLPPPLQIGEGDGLPRWLAQDALASAAHHYHPQVGLNRLHCEAHAMPFVGRA